ncbi:MAG: glycosyltransferase [Desulfobacterales bacterium]|nr:glycosyltransferase [Desulfobacteraceae bacterium]MBT7086746.1 glycosyltransferase [Desulfobacterales bacterium]
MTLSVIIPAYNAEKTLNILLDSLAKQSFNDYETIVINDCSTDNTSKIAETYDCKLIELKENRGPAYCRNIGVKKAKGDIIVFTDSDCNVSAEWLETIQRIFTDKNINAVMGKLVLLPSTFLGDSISALGFPAGGAIGFDKIWRVDEKGFTDSLSTCNCAVRKTTFNKAGKFDETFPYPGGEDTLLARNLLNFGNRIKYCPDIIVYHEARDSFSGFLKWQFRRGISSYIFSRKIINKGRFMSLRIWSTRNIIKHNCKDPKFPLIIFLLFTGFAVQAAGFVFARHSKGFV